MRILYIGSVEFSGGILIRLIEIGADIVGVLTKKEPENNADFFDLSEIANQHGVPFAYTKNVNSKDTVSWIKMMRPDIIFCVGFSHLLKREVLRIPKMGVVGYHPSLLPSNRGRHPIIWALALGLSKTGSTFFFMDEGVDSGDILDTEEVIIGYSDNARSLYDKITNVASGQAARLHKRLRDGSFLRIPQDHSAANYWRKRNRLDGQIDFRMNSRAIYNSVRALSHPYAGAHIMHMGRENKVWAAEEADVDLGNIECGKTLEVNEGNILVKCNGGGIILKEHEFEHVPKVGDYL